MNLNQITIYTHRTVDTVKFYEKLGLRIIVNSLPRYARLQCPDGEATLSVHHSEQAASSSNIVIYFECENLDERVSTLKDVGLKFESDAQDQTWLWREIYLRDPNGNRICLYYAGENRQNPPWRVKS